MGPGVPELPAPSAGPYNAETDDPLYDPSSSSAYSFGFDADGYNREESADDLGNVVGSYSYVDAAGVTRTVSYRAGQNLGFVPQANFLNSDLQVDIIYRKIHFLQPNLCNPTL